MSVFVFLEVGTFVHSCQNDLVCKSTITKVPYFNAPIYLENKSQIGKIDEIFGPMNDFVSSVHVYNVATLSATPDIIFRIIGVLCVYSLII